MKRLKTWHKVVLGLLVLSIIGNLLPQKKEAILKEPPPIETTQSKIEKLFSGWDGSNENLVKTVKANMNDPESFEHVETRHWLLKDTVVIKMTYRGKNAFGGVVTEMVRAKALPTGEIVSIEQQ